MVGAKLDGFDTMVRLTAEAPVIVLEGDEYLSSPIDRRPKFHWYKPHIAILSGMLGTTLMCFQHLKIMSISLGFLKMMLKMYFLL